MRKKNQRNLFLKTNYLILFVFVVSFAFTNKVDAAKIKFKDCSSVKYTCAYYDLAKATNATMSCSQDNNFSALYNDTTGRVNYCTQLGKALSYSGSYPTASFTNVSATSGVYMWDARFIAFGYNGTNGSQYPCDLARIATQMLIHLNHRQGINYIKGISASTVKGWLSSNTSTAYKNGISSKFVEIRDKAVNYIPKSPSYNGKTVTLKYNYSTNRYEGSITDSNGSLTKAALDANVWKLKSKSSSSLNYSVSGSKLTLYTTSPTLTNGSITFSRDNLPPDTIHVSNFAAHSYGTYQITTYIDAAEKSETVTINYKLELEDLKITKISSSGVLEGAKFQLYTDNKCTHAYGPEMTTNSNGEILFSNIPAGTYYVKETSVPVGYAISGSNCKKATTETGSLLVMNATNSVKLSKKDESGNPLGNAVFALFNNSTCTERTKKPGTSIDFPTARTDPKSGMVTFEGMEAKNPTTGNSTYYLGEITPPPGYYINNADFCKAVTVNGHPVISVNHINTVEIMKVSSNGTKLNGAVFELYSDANCQTRAKNALGTGNIEPVVSGSNGLNPGQIVFKGMDGKQSTYYIYESTPPKGYYTLPRCTASVTTNCNCMPVHINGNPIPVTNTKILVNEITVQKRDGYTKFGIDGVKIGLFSDSSCKQPVTGTDGTPTVGTTKNGQVKFVFETPEGTTSTFYTREIETPEGYVPENGQGKYDCKELRIGENTTQNSVIIYNMPYGNIKLLKLEINTDKVLPGIEFSITDEEGKQVKDINGNVVLNQTTDSNGMVEFKNILYGTYIIKEVKSDGIHKLLKEPIKIILNNQTDSIVLAKTGTTRYMLGDLNGDSVVDNADLAIYQELVDNPESRFGLSPDIKAAMDINGDSNINDADVEKDMNIATYYVTFVKGEDRAVLDAANNYSNYKKNYCNSLDGMQCIVSGLNDLYNMYTTNKPILAEIEAAKAGAQAEATAANEAANVQYENARDQYYDVDLPAYQTYMEMCPQGPDTLAETSDPDEPQSIKPGCEVAVPQPILPTPPAPVVPADICHPDFDTRLVNDLNHDCEINQADVDAATDDALKSIISRYIDYTASPNEEDIFINMNIFKNNRQVLCAALGKTTCVINDSYLKDALTKVGKTNTLPTNVARSSLTVTNDLIYIEISKQSITKAKELPGAKIIIRDEKGNKILEYTSTKTPKKFSLAAGKYTLTEKISPKGYKNLSTVVSFEVLDNGSTKLLGASSNFYKIKKGSDGDMNHLIIYNELNEKVPIPVPDTGSNVAAVSVAIGAILVICGSAILYKKLV